MKINIVPTSIAIIAAALLALLFYSISGADDQMLKALAVSGFTSIFVCLECGIGISFRDSHHTVNSFAVSMLFLVVFIVEHCCFAAWGSNLSWLMIVTGLLLVLYILIYYNITQTKM